MSESYSFRGVPSPYILEVFERLRREKVPPRDLYPEVLNGGAKRLMWGSPKI